MSGLPVKMETAKVVRLPSCISLSNKTSLEGLRGH